VPLGIRVRLGTTPAERRNRGDTDADEQPSAVVSEPHRTPFHGDNWSTTIADTASCRDYQILKESLDKGRHRIA
jgi:hypothetical protein